MHVSLDESGKFRSTENLAFFGLVGDLPDWESFSTDWDALAREHHIRSVHTTNLMSRSPEYQGRTFGSRQEKPSVVTSKPANEGHFKTGQRGRNQNDSVVPRRSLLRQEVSKSSSLRATRGFRLRNR